MRNKSMTAKILDNLTGPQKEAVTHIDGPMLVVAGAGSGKTRVVTRRIAYLIENAVQPHQILAMTFTNKAAGEMKRRVAGLTGREPRWVGTFHSMCARFLRYDLDKLNEGRDGRFSIFDDDDQMGLVKSILKDLSLGDSNAKPRSLLSSISRVKCDMASPDEVAGNSWLGQILPRVYKEYQKRLHDMNALDFDDLLVLTVRLLSRREDVREAYCCRFRYLLIDEYQDTNRAQYRLMRLLTGRDENVHVTGDPDQSIYSWRGADYRNIMDFQKDFPGARIVRLEQNYRSTRTILEVANAVIRNNEERIEKNLFTENPIGENLLMACLSDERNEADWVAMQVNSLRAGDMRLRDMAVFYRTNAQSRSFEESLMRARIPYQIIGGIRFYQRKEIKDLLAHLKIMVNPRDAISLDRVTSCRPTGVGAKTLRAVLEQAKAAGEPPFIFLQRKDFADVFKGRTSTKLRDFARWCCRLGKVPHKPVAACVQEVVKISGLLEHLDSRIGKDPAAEDRIQNLEAFVNRAAEFGNEHPESDLGQFLEDVALVADVDAWDPDADQLSLMTLHSAKGLEFPAVFIVGLEDGLLPHKNSWEPDKLAEERRLFYVGLTRAKEKVFLSYAAFRYIYGQEGVSSPSRFLLEMPPGQIQVMEPDSGYGSRGQNQYNPDDWDCLDEDFDVDF